METEAGISGHNFANKKRIRKSAYFSDEEELSDWMFLQARFVWINRNDSFSVLGSRNWVSSFIQKILFIIFGWINSVIINSNHTNLVSDELAEFSEAYSLIIFLLFYPSNFVFEKFKSFAINTLISQSPRLILIHSWNLLRKNFSLIQYWLLVHWIHHFSLDIYGRVLLNFHSIFKNSVFELMRM